MKRDDLEAGGNLFWNSPRSSQGTEFSKSQNWPWEPWTFLSTWSCPCSTDSPLPFEGCRRDIDWASAKKTSIATRFEKIQRVIHLVKINNESKVTAAAAAKSLQSCPTLCSPIDGSPLGSSIPGILQARTLEWVAISFSNPWKWKVKVKSLSCVWPSVTPWTAPFQAPPSMGFSRQEYWSGCHCLLWPFHAGNP